VKLPHVELAVVDIAKLRDYCLNADHLRGRHKARVFAAVRTENVVGRQYQRPAPRVHPEGLSRLGPWTTRAAIGHRRSVSKRGWP
jgi:hypothetical protein